MESRVAIKDFYGRILGWIITSPNGDKRITDFSGRILGFYRANYDHTTDFYGRIIGNGDQLTSLLPRD